jgi:hypothetical protein
MADPYIPFGYMPPTLGGPMRQRPLTPFPIPPLPEIPAFSTGATMPNEAEAMDLRQQGQGMINAAGFAAPFALAGPVGMAGKLGMEAIRRFPQLAAGIGAIGGTGAIMGAMEPAPVGAQRAPQPTDAVRALQRRLQEEGLYAGKIDGVMGTETQKAAAELEKIEARRSKQRERDQALELERARNETERARVQQQQQETDRLRLEGQQADDLVRQGTEKLKNLQPGFMEQYGTPLGYGAGLLLGGAGRYGLGRFMAREQREIANRANTLSRQMVSGQADDVPARAARVNQFWSEGAPGTPAPFGFQSGRQPFPWATNQNAVPPGQLYAPPTGLAGAIRNYGPSSPGGILSAAEMGYGGVNLVNAHRELQAAEDALSQPKGATPANVQRVEAARQAVADANFMLRMGMGTAGGTMLGQLESNFTRSGLRPPVLEADAERGRLDAILNPRNAPPPPLNRIPKGQPGAGRFLPRR